MKTKSRTSIDVTIIITADKSNVNLIKTIESAKNQDYQQKKYEILLISNGNPGLPMLAKKHKIKYKYILPGNISTAINMGIKLARGNYIKIIKANDILRPNCLTESINTITSRGYDFVHGPVEMFNMLDGKIKHQHTYRHPTIIPTFKQMLAFNIIHNASVLYKKDVFATFGLFNEELECAEVYEYHLRLLKAGCSLGYVEKVTVEYYMHGEDRISDLEEAEKGRKIITKIKEKYGVTKPLDEDIAIKKASTPPSLLEVDSKEKYFYCPVCNDCYPESRREFHQHKTI